MDDLIEGIIVIVGTVALFFAIIFGLTALFEASDKSDCKQKGELAQVTTKYVNGNCKVDLNGTLIPFDTWKFNRDHGIKMS